MASTQGTKGRLCNHFIRNMFVSILAERMDLSVDYSYRDTIEALGIELFSGKNVYQNWLVLTDYNIMQVIESNTPPATLSIADCTYFQTNACSHYLHNYLRSEKIMNRVVKLNRYTQRYNNNNDAFIHIRLGDIAHNTPGFKYFDKVLSSIEFNKGFIASDSPDHSIIKDLVQKYPNIEVTNYDEIDTILFGSTCKNVILSHGSFSATIGNLSFNSNVYYPKYEEDKKWYGDMFTNIPGWIRVDF